MPETPPYGFVPVPPAPSEDSLHDAPILHDGRNADQGALLSGELSLTLTALTPLLVANDQYSAADCEGATAYDDQDVTLPPGWILRDASDGPVGRVRRDKKILEPLRLPDGRVAISPAALKGALRHGLGALLGAPMERVAERTYSYRPNMGFGGPQAKLEPRPALVDGMMDGQLRLRLLPKSLARHNAIQFLDDRGRFQGQEPNPATHTVVSYVGGLDGRGDFARAFRETNGHGSGRVHFQAAIPNAQVTGPIVIVPPEVLVHYRRTTDHLADQLVGHLRSLHPLKERLKERPTIAAVAANVRAAADTALAPGTLIYVEIRSGTDEIVSMGHSVRYRWRFRDTVRKRLVDGKEVDREILVPTARERRTTADGRPEALSAARLLFGYAAGGAKDGSAGIGGGAFQQLSGRLAFNMALEHLPADVDGRDDDRFLRHDAAFLVPLKILGAPRPSATEHYIVQPEPAALAAQRGDQGRYATYGDLLDDHAGDLAGRKFYRHQPDAATDPGCYEDRDVTVLEGNQAAIGRFVSAPGSRFRVTLRFRDLRSWELGAVLATLQPERVLENVRGRIGQDGAGSILLRKLRDGPDTQPEFALKLGHGRPLGLGSVRVEVDRCRILDARGAWRPDGQAVTRDALAALGQRYLDTARPDVLLAWLDIHRFRGRTRSAYPADGTIMAHHQNLRVAHARGRRQ